MANECDTEFWEGMSDVYSADDQADAPQRIVDRLFDTGSITGSDCVLEVGAGPGTYSLLLAHRVRILVCMDSSETMLDRLFAPTGRSWRAAGSRGSIRTGRRTSPGRATTSASHPFSRDPRPARPWRGWRVRRAEDAP